MCPSGVHLSVKTREIRRFTGPIGFTVHRFPLAFQPYHIPVLMVPDFLNGSDSVCLAGKI